MLIFRTAVAGAYERLPMGYADPMAATEQTYAYLAPTCQAVIRARVGDERGWPLSCPDIAPDSRYGSTVHERVRDHA